jgi:hypothetical protein
VALPDEATLEGLAVPVTSEENRAVVFTNKRAAYFYAQTHRNTHSEHAGYRGYDIAGRHILSDYRPVVNGAQLDPATARAAVLPEALVHEYPGGATETLRLVDHRDLIEVVVTGAPGAVRVVLAGDELSRAAAETGIDWYVSGREHRPPAVDFVAVGRVQNRLLIAVGPSRAAAAALLEADLADPGRWQSARHARLDRLINGDHYPWTDDPGLTRALRWITLTTGELVTRQRGVGRRDGVRRRDPAAPRGMRGRSGRGASGAAWDR